MSSPQAIPTLTYGEFSRALHDRAASDDRVIKAQVELTNRCNLHCRHCYTDPYNTPESIRRELTVEAWLALLRSMRDIGVVWLNLTGGDIFMHPHFFTIYEAAHRHGFLVQLYTNGTLFTRAIVQRLERMPPFTLDVSVHTVDEGRFDWFTQVPGSFRAFIRGMELLRRSPLPLSFKTKAMNWNQDELPAIQAFVESFDQSFGYTTSLSPRLNGDCSPLEFRLAPRQVTQLEGIDQSCSASWLSRGGEATAGAPPDRLYRCGCGTDTIHVNAWGELGTCTMQYEHRASLRDFSLREAIDRVFTAVRAARYQSMSPCRTCAIYKFCDKKPDEARRECGSVEAPIAYNCDLAVGRATALTGTPVPHPLQELINLRGTDE